MTPSMAIKFLRDGVDSANVVSMHNLDGFGKDWNFFSKEFTNNGIAWSKRIEIVALAHKFSKYTEMIQSVGTLNLAKQQ
jgi:hypothetical protein